MACILELASNQPTQSKDQTLDDDDASTDRSVSYMSQFNYLDSERHPSKGIIGKSHQRRNLD